VIPLDFAVGLGTGLAIAIVLYALLRWWGRRIGDVPPHPLPVPNGVGPNPTLGPPDPTTTSTPEPAILAEGTPAAVAAPALPPDLPPRSVSTPRASAGRTGPVAPREQVRLSQRVILHVFGQGVLPSGSVAPLALSQAGMMEALGVPQPGLAPVLRRLEAANILTSERGHVRGRDRRLKVYRLTDRGLELAKELRVRRARAGGRRAPAESGPTSTEGT
jgi:DNA-binding MarR family transcriptional regulator